jgi:hypothetical protein
VETAPLRARQRKHSQNIRFCRRFCGNPQNSRTPIDIYFRQDRMSFRRYQHASLPSILLLAVLATVQRLALSALKRCFWIMEAAATWK